MTNKLKIKKVRDNVSMPVRSSLDAAGMDLHAARSYIIKAGERAVISTGIAMEIPSGYYGSIQPRSGLAVRHGIDTLAGIIDSDYRGEIAVILINHGDDDFNVIAGDRVAQMIIQRHHTGSMMLALVTELGGSDRGSNGFGSTGK